MAYESYCISDPALNTIDLAKRDTSTPELFAAVGFENWGVKLSSDAFNNAREAQALYLSWSTVEERVETTYDVIKIEKSGDFSIMLPELDHHRFVSELERIQKLGIFQTLFVLTLKSDAAGYDNEYIVVGCTDERTIREPYQRDTTSYVDRLMDEYGDFQTLISRVERMERAEARQRRDEEWNAEQRKSHLLDVLDSDPEYCFAICRFTKSPYFAGDEPRVVEPSAIYQPKKPSRFEVSKAELNRLPTSWTSKTWTYGLCLLYVAMLTFFVVSGAWVTALVCLPIYTAIVAWNARRTNGMQIAYLKAKHAVLPRKTWETGQIEM